MMEVKNLLAVARELKRPLVQLRQLALTVEETESTAKHTPAIQQMVAVAEQALQQTDDLMRLEQLQHFALGPVAVRAACASISATNTDIQINYHNHHRLAVANPDLLNSILRNFILGATQYSSTQRIRLAVHDQHECIRILVRDYGPAIPATTWRAITAGLSQPTPIPMRPGSSALGLYLAGEFSRYMHGRVGAVRHQDGASFYVELPAVSQAKLL